MRPIKIDQIVQAVGGKLLCGSDTKQIQEVVIDSRSTSKNGLFVPIVGEQTDGHNYIMGAVEHGAAAVLSAVSYAGQEKVVEECSKQDVAVIEVEDTVFALQKLAAWYRSSFQIPVIGITGSVGKTTTKEMISAALETKYKVLKTIGNKNSQIGLPLMMFYLEEEYDIAVIEMGMSEFGEMARLSAVAQPECAVMTNIGVAHIAQLGTQENIRREKLSIVNHFVTGSTLFLNGNDRLLHEIATQITQNKITLDCSIETKQVLEQSKAVTFGIGEGYDYCADGLQTTSSGTNFTLHYTEAGTKQECPVILSVYGEHNVMNALAAIAVAKKYGVSPEQAAEGLRTYQPIAMRGQIIEKNGITWIDDTYNASPDSMKSGAKVLLALEQVQRRIAVLADVKELGERSEELHSEVGAYLADLKDGNKKINLLITVGMQAAFIAIEARKKNCDFTCVSFENNEEAIEFLQKELKQGDAVLVKGSRGMKTDEIVKAFCG